MNGKRGRKPRVNPIYVNAEGGLRERVQAQIAVEEKKHEGLLVDLSGMARVLICESLGARERSQGKAE